MNKIEFTFIDEKYEKKLVMILHVFMIAKHYGIIYQ